jgi:hypothetical protein
LKIAQKYISENHFPRTAVGFSYELGWVSLFVVLAMKQGGDFGKL